MKSLFIVFSLTLAIAGAWCVTLSIQVYMNPLNSLSIGANIGPKTIMEPITEFGLETRVRPEADSGIRDSKIAKLVSKVVGLVNAKYYKGLQRCKNMTFMQDGEKIRR